MANQNEINLSQNPNPRIEEIIEENDDFFYDSREELGANELDFLIQIYKQTISYLNKIIQNKTNDLNKLEDVVVDEELVVVDEELVVVDEELDVVDEESEAQ